MIAIGGEERKAEEIKMEEIKTRARYMVDRLGLRMSAHFLSVTEEALSLFLETGQIKTMRTRSALNRHYKELKLDEKTKPSFVKNYDHEDMEDFKGGLRKGGAGGNSNNAGPIQVGSLYL